ncbi:MAG: catechol 2,3-dioxygenase [Terriglobales bacterium]
MTYRPSFQDIAHVGHVELLTPKFEESVAFFKNIVGLHESGRSGSSVYLRAWGDYARYTLKLTASPKPGLGHLAFRTRSAEVLHSMVGFLQENGVAGAWHDGDFGHGRAFRFSSPDGHALELYFEAERFTPSVENRPGFKNQPQKYIPRGIAPRRLDHINLLAQDVGACRLFFRDLLGMRVTEQIIFADEGEMGAWLATTLKSYDVAFTRDHSPAHGRFHHLTYFMDSREDVLRAADILVENNVFIETGPHKHSIGQTFFLYCYEPGGNRFEIGAGGYLILDPEWQPVVWSKEERPKGQAWGLQTVSTFHTYGTP